MNLCSVVSLCTLTAIAIATLIWSSIITSGLVQLQNTCAVGDWRHVVGNSQEITTTKTVVIDSTTPLLFTHNGTGYSIQVTSEGALQIVFSETNRTLVTLTNATTAIGPLLASNQDTLLVTPQSEFQATPFYQPSSVNQLVNTGSGVAFADTDGIVYAGIQTMQSSNGVAGEVGLGFAVGRQSVPTLTMFLDPDGNVGINTESPRATLDVNGMLLARQLSLRISDIRSKYDISEINRQEAYEGIMALQAVEYHRRGFPKNAKEAGFLAQQVRQVFPNVVHELADGTLAVDYEQLIPYSIAALQYMKNRSMSY